jgi:hypothetical protein
MVVLVVEVTTLDVVDDGGAATLVDPQAANRAAIPANTMTRRDMMRPRFQRVDSWR